MADDASPEPGDGATESEVQSVQSPTPKQGWKIAIAVTILVPACTLGLFAYYYYNVLKLKTQAPRKMLADSWNESLRRVGKKWEEWSAEPPYKCPGPTQNVIRPVSLKLEDIVQDEGEVELGLRVVVHTTSYVHTLAIFLGTLYPNEQSRPFRLWAVIDGVVQPDPIKTWQFDDQQMTLGWHEYALPSALVLEPGAYVFSTTIRGKFLVERFESGAQYNRDQATINFVQCYVARPGKRPVFECEGQNFLIDLSYCTHEKCMTVSNASNTATAQ